jgi:hypothetical protein
MYLDANTVLMDTAMPYRELPVYRIAPADILGTPYGYTPMFDLMPIQESINSLYSTVLTNQNAFGIQSVLNPRGNDVRITQVAEGLNFIEYNPTVAGGGSGAPTPLNLTSTPQEVFSFMELLQRQMETISGMNPVVRGSAEKGVTSGSALALIQSQALQYISGLQQSYIMLIEDIGTGLIKLLQDFASVPRVAEIAGLSNRSKLTEFTGEDIDSINRVVVDVGNALSQTTAGRIQMADNLLQMQAIKTVDQYYSVINSGRLDVMTEASHNEMLLIKSENEKLAQMELPKALATDAHSKHIQEHLTVLGCVLSERL